ncbi:hypothetical protein SAMN04489712_11986 [Thermomonospora echinospora]|uniref:Carboxypeptidase regulatory-like domain-containing protein n=1 Tax=Thermomonospora echinospora TaxID=1992 RepID=A0A1H6DMI5_9ACTN|nr:hypothetical protein [Thermomonospora echinospora]SEG86448.1 hypothetical protein SAMN04489712_11986 [Thermomonospora echinospora]
MDEDSELEARLRRAVAFLDPVPPESLRVAREALVFRALDAELAELAFDSLDDAAPVRGPGRAQGPRFLTFRAGETTIEVEVTDPPRRIVGRLIPADTAEPVRIRRPGGSTTVTVDALGRFTAPLSGPGPFSLRYGRVVTDWVNP